MDLETTLTHRWQVIEFNEGIGRRSVSLVPSKWLKMSEGELTASWPPYLDDSRMKKAVKNEEDPEPGWITYRCRLLHRYRTGMGYSMQKVCKVANSAIAL